MSRTTQQNKALHLWARNVAKELNRQGLSVQHVLNHAKVELDWNENLVKEQLWRPIQKAITGKESTTEPETQDYVLIYDTLNRFLSDKFGFFEPWPDRLTLEAELME